MALNERAGERLSETQERLCLTGPPLPHCGPQSLPHSLTHSLTPSPVSMSVRGNFLDSWQSRDRQARTTTATKRPNELTGRRKDGRREGGKADRRLFCLTVLSKLGRRCARASGLCFTDRGNSDGRGCKIPRRSLSLSFLIIHSTRQRQWIERKKERKKGKYSKGKRCLSWCCGFRGGPPGQFDTMALPRQRVGSVQVLLFPHRHR